MYNQRILEESGKTERDLAEKDEETAKLKERADYYKKKYNNLCRVYNELKEGDCDKSKPRLSINPSSISRIIHQKKKKSQYNELMDEQEDKEKLNPKVSYNNALSRNSHSFKSISAEEDSVFDRLQRSSTAIKSRTSLGGEYCSNPVQKWQIVNNIEAHEGPLSSMFTIENMLYTASNQIFRFWSLETFNMIGQVTDHAGMIKSMAYWEEKKSLLTCSGNTINQYDTLTITKSASFKGHTDQIRVMKVYDNLLFSAGKGNPFSMFVWDLRKLDTPVQEKEKGLDIFSLLITEDTVYSGCRDHKIHRMKLNDLGTLKPYETSHYDTVTCLALYDNSIISGSRDKSLRIWDQDKDNENKSIINAHTDWINCLNTDSFDRCVYSGGKDGKIRVWKGNYSEINHVGEMNAHNASINCLVSLPSLSQTLISGSSDRTFKVWKLSEEFE